MLFEEQHKCTYVHYLADNISRNSDSVVRSDGMLPSLSVKFVSAPADSNILTIDSNSQITAEK